LFYGVIDGLGWRRWSFFFVVIGANAITIYLLQEIVPFEQVSRNLLGGSARALGSFGPALIVMGALALKWLVLWDLYRRRLFLRV
jgi:predicted acyltransferase